MATANKYEAICCDCTKTVEALAGRLYRYSGGNKHKRPANCCGHRRINEFATVYFAVRCMDCAEKRGDVKYRKEPDYRETRLEMMEAGAAELR